MHFLKRIARASVWAKDGVKPEDWRYRGIYRYVLPVTDLLFFWFGLVGALNGIASVEDAAGSTWQTWWSAGIALSALACLIGVAFPRLWALEQSAKIILIGLVSAYVALHVGRGIDDPRTLATAGLIVILVLLPIWRVGDLVIAKQNRGR